MPERNPSSRCIAFTSFEFYSSTPALNPKRRRPGSLGIVTVTFRRNGRSYTLRNPMRWDEWGKFVKSRSVGRFWNYRMKGQYG